MQGFWIVPMNKYVFTRCLRFALTGSYQSTMQGFWIADFMIWEFSNIQITQVRSIFLKSKI